MALGSGVTIANISDYYHHNDSNFQALSDHEPEPVFAHSSRGRGRICQNLDLF